MKAFGQLVVDFVWECLKLGATIVIGTGKLVGWVLSPLLAAGVQRMRALPKVLAPRVEIAPVQVSIPELPAALAQDTGPATIIHNHFEWADRIVSIRLEPYVGTINLRVFKDTVKRDLIISEPRLRALMKGRRHTFPDAKFDPKLGIHAMDELKDETIVLAEELINKLGSQSVKGIKPRKDDFVRAKAPAPPAPAPAPVVKEQVRQEQPKPAPAPAPQQAEQRSPGPQSTLVAPRVTTGYTYVGKLVEAGSKKMTPAGRAPYEVFEATLLLDNGAEMALRGAELERELESNGCRIGQRVEITPLGKIPVSLGNGGEGQKNLYRVQTVGAAKRA